MRFVTNAYRALLHLLPASFRHEYGTEMLDVFERNARQASSRAGRASALLAGGADIVATALTVHRDMLVQDLHYTARTLRRAPAFAATAILVTALGIGATTAAFSIADFVLIRPMPFTSPESLVKLWASPPGGGGRMELSPPNYRDIKAASRSFATMGAYHPLSANLSGDGEPQRIEGAVVSSEVLPMLGVQPVIGRLFTQQDALVGNTDEVILSHAFWQEAYGGDDAIVGRRLLMNGSSRVVIGVMPATFSFPNRRVSAWTPMPRDELTNEERDNNWFQVIARLRPGVSIEPARAETKAIAARLAEQFPAENEGVGASVFTMRDELSQQSRVLLLGLCGAAACLLLLACTNLANLLLARALARRREIVVRSALGAGRDRIARQLVTESLTLAIIGGALGVAIAVATVPLLAQLIPNTLPLSESPSVDPRVLLFAAITTCVTGLAFGTLPALRATGSSRGSGFDALRDGARAGGGQRSRLRATLVATQVMACVVLLVTSGLLVQALIRVQNTDPGFRTAGVMTVRTALSMPQYLTLASRLRFYDDVLSKVRALPGVSAAAYVSFIPMVWGGGIFEVGIPGKTEDRAQGHVAALRFATPGYFGSMGIPLQRGRDLAESDAMNAPFVAVVSESFAKRYWPNESALGKRFDFGFNERTVVGVVGDVRVRGLERRSEPQVYLSYRQVPDSSLPAFVPKDLVIRSSSSPAALLPAVREIVRAVDARQPVSDVQTLDQVVAGQTASRSVQVYVLGGFAGLAFLLAAIGIHGLLLFTVSTRRHEIGVRMALGATPARVVGLVVRQGALLALGGIIPGVALAYVAGRSMGAVLMGVQPGDAVTYLFAVLLCGVMAVAGSLQPALRAVQVPPASALRAE